MTMKLFYIVIICHSITYEAFAACDCSVNLVFASPTKAAGTAVGSYQSDTTDPLGPWKNNSVCFEGTNLGDITTFDYLITCTEACYIMDITIEGIAWFTTTLSIYNSDKSNLLGQIERNDKNTFQQYTVPTTTETYLTQWRFTDTTPICCFRYRHSITMRTKTISETFAPTAPTASPTTRTLSPTSAPITPISLPVYSNECDCTVSLIFASPRYPIGSTSMSYPSESTNPLAIWIGESVKFQGTNEGNVTTFDYQIDCNIPCWIQDLTIQGIAWFTTTISVYNGDKSILLGEINKNDENTFQTYTINMSSNEQYLTRFRVIDTSYICCWRYRSLINITAIPKILTDSPTSNPSSTPSNDPSTSPSRIPTNNPSNNPTANPSNNPTYNPTFNPTKSPFQIPSLYPTLSPSYNPSIAPTKKPTNDGQTNDETTFSPETSNDQDQYIANSGSDHLVNYIFIVVGAVCLCCCIVCIVYGLKYKQKKQKLIKADTIAKNTTNGTGTNMGIATQMEVCSMSSSNNFSPSANNSFHFAQTNEMIIDDTIHQMNTPRSITNYANEVNVESDIEEGVIMTIPTNNYNSNEKEIEMTNVTTPNGYDNNMRTPGNENENVPNLRDDEFIIEGDIDDHEFVGNEIMENVNGVTNGYIENCQQEQVQENDDEDMDVLDIVNATPM